MAKGFIPTEAQEQELIFEWASIAQGRYPELALLHAIPNGGSRNKIEAAHLQKQGVKAGVPDIFLPVSNGRYNGLYIELKRTKGGRVSAEQGRWITLLRENGYQAEVIKGAEEAIRLITHYLNEKRT